MKQILSAVLFISMIFFSCQKEFNERNGSNAPGSNTRGPKGPKTNRPPVANAGPDQTIILPTNTVTLDGSASTDPNNDISSYLWRKISGPSSFIIANANTVQTQVTNLVQGIYQFELKVIDARGLFDKDTVQIMVMMMNLPPPCTTCKIVFVSARDGNNEIYTSNTDGSNITRLTNDPGNDGQPKWSPDGTRIAFTSDRGGNPGLYIMNADGSNVVLRTSLAYLGMGLTWSPDGTNIAYSDNGEYGNAIYVVAATSGSPVLLSAPTGNDVNPAWSPDGTKIAVSGYYCSDYYYDYQGINTINPNDGAVSGVLTTNYCGFDFNYPSWSPNGAKLAMVLDYTVVDVMNSDGSGHISLISGAALGTGTSWSTDGTVIVYTSWSGSMMSVSWVAVDGSAGGTIVTNGWDADWKH